MDRNNFRHLIALPILIGVFLSLSWYAYNQTPEVQQKRNTIRWLLLDACYRDDQCRLTADELYEMRSVKTAIDNYR